MSLETVVKAGISKEAKTVTNNPFTLFSENLEKLKSCKGVERNCDTNDCGEVEFNISEHCIKYAIIRVFTDLYSHIFYIAETESSFGR